MYAATELSGATSVDGQICAGDDDWYEINDGGAFTVTLDFDDSAGDLDMEAVDAAGNQLGVSSGSGNEESLTESGPFYVHVYGYNGATNSYTLTVGAGSSDTGSTDTGGSASPPPSYGCDPSSSDDTMGSANVLTGATTIDAQICAGDDDWYEIDASGEWTVTIDFDATGGDLDMEAVDMDGNQLAVSNGSGSEETVMESGPFYVHVYGYDGATNSYTLTVE